MDDIGTVIKPQLFLGMNKSRRRRFLRNRTRKHKSYQRGGSLQWVIEARANPYYTNRFDPNQPFPVIPIDQNDTLGDVNLLDVAKHVQFWFPNVTTPQGFVDRLEQLKRDDTFISLAVPNIRLTEQILREDSRDIDLEDTNKYPLLIWSLMVSFPPDTVLIPILDTTKPPPY